MRLYAILTILLAVFIVYLWAQSWKYRTRPGLPIVEREIRGNVTLEDLGGEYDGR